MYNFVKKQIKKSVSQLKAKHKGFVVILIAVLIPVIILSVRYVIQFSKLKNSELYQPPAKSDTNNANQTKLVALEVAKAFNPGTPLNKQQSLMNQIAKAALAKYASASIADSAIPGLGDQVVSTISYKEPYYRYAFSASTHNHYIALNKVINLFKNAEQFSECDKILQVIVNDDISTKPKTFHIIANQLYENLFTSLPSGVSFSKQEKIKEESYERALDSAIDLNVSINNNNIQVTLNDLTATSIPATCNADIILTIPTNAGASQNLNQDSSSSPKASYPTYMPTQTTASSEYSTTPITQIKQAYKAFLKKNFFYTKGVYVGIVPYSAKVSLNSDKTAYTQKYASFNNTMQNFSRRAFFYGTNTAQNNLNNNTYDWNSDITGCPIMFKTNAVTTLDANNIQKPDILSISNTSKFIQMNLNPPSLNSISFVSMSNLYAPQPFIPHPFPIMELSDDIRYIYEQLSTYTPILDTFNNSNFLFIPINWTHNLLQSWTNNPSNTATSQKLSSESKLTPNRKKALILIVNKPDFFDHGELTYLGFDNDLAQVSMIESDKLNFQINHANTTEKDAFGTAFNSKIEGHKRLIKYTNVQNASWNESAKAYTCTSGKAKITVPKRGLLILTVDKFNTLSTTEYAETLSIAAIHSWSSMTYGNGKFAAITAAAEIAVSLDFKNWTKI